MECLRAGMADELFVNCRWLRDGIRNDPQPQNLVILDVSWASDKDMEEDYHRFTQQYIYECIHSVRKFKS